MWHSYELRTDCIFCTIQQRSENFWYYRIFIISKNENLEKSILHTDESWIDIVSKKRQEEGNRLGQDCRDQTGILPKYNLKFKKIYCTHILQ